jgi:hypothetical protein
LIIKSLLEAVPKPNLIMLKLKVFTFTEMRKRSSPPYEGGAWGGWTRTLSFIKV